MFPRIRAFAGPNLPPLIIAGCLVLEILAVYSVERWVLRDGSPLTHVHARQKIDQEVRSRFQQGVLMLHAKQFEHALTAFHRVLQLAPRMPEAHVNMGFAMLGLQRYKEANDFFAGALALRPEQVNAYYGAALAAEGMGQRTDAIHAMYHYLSLSPAEDPYRAKAEGLLMAWRETAQPGSAPAAADAKKNSAPAGRRAESPRR